VSAKNGLRINIRCFDKPYARAVDDLSDNYSLLKERNPETARLVLYPDTSVDELNDTQAADDDIPETPQPQPQSVEQEKS
jgi:hypothetical protein